MNGDTHIAARPVADETSPVGALRRLLAADAAVNPAARASGTRCRYVAIPSATAPRLLAPLDVPLPRWGAGAPPWQRVGARCVATLLQCGGARLVGDVVAVAADRPSPIQQIVAHACRRQDLRLAFFVGTPGPEQKIRVAALDAAGNEIAFAKIAVGAAADERVECELAMLRLVQRQACAPVVLGEGTLDGRRYLLEQAVGGTASPTTAGAAHRKFLLRLVCPESPRLVCESTMWTRLEIAEEELPRPYRRSYGQLRQLAARLQARLGGQRLPATMVHGDFAPWNVLLAGNELWALDWEHGVGDGLPFFDAIHWMFQGLTLRKKRSAPEAAREIAQLRPGSLVADYGARLGVAPELARAFLSLYFCYRLCWTARVNARHGYDPDGQWWDCAGWLAAASEEWNGRA